MKLKIILCFLVLNFGGLYLGQLLQGAGPMSSWYQNLNIAPWTPPGWFFAVAWSVIMLCFSFYMAAIYQTKNNKGELVLFGISFVLNVIWNFLFFNQHLLLISLVTIVLLFVVLVILYMKYKNQIGKYDFLMFPYLIWLVIAISLNAYAWLYN